MTEAVKNPRVVRKSRAKKDAAVKRHSELYRYLMGHVSYRAIHTSLFFDLERKLGFKLCAKIEMRCAIMRATKPLMQGKSLQFMSIDNAP